MLRQRAAIYALFGRLAYEAVNRRARARLGLPARERVAPPPVDPVVPAPIVPEMPAEEGAEPTERWGAAAEDQQEAPSLGWLDRFEMLDHYVYPAVFPEVVSEHWGENFVHNFDIPRGGRWMSLGCGGGNMELQMAADGLFSSMDAFDPSEGAIGVARDEAKNRGIDTVNFQVAAINSMKMPANTYDVVHINMALHHCSNLERVLVEINDTLVDGGVLVVNEFVGANQFQYPDSQVALVNGLLALLPERLRWNPIAKEVKTQYPRYTRAFWNDWDPTESIRSDEIPVALGRVFPAMVRRDYGGTILNLLLENIVQNFDFNDKEDLATMNALVRIERDLINTGMLGSDFALFICPKGGPLARARGRAVATLDVRRRITMAIRRRAAG